MADLAQLGISVTLNDQNVDKKLAALSTAADKAATSVDKLEESAKKASKSIGDVGGKKATDSLKNTQAATEKAHKSYLQFLGDVNKLNKAFGEVGKTQTGIKELQKNLNAVGAEAKKAYDAGELSKKGFNDIANASDKLALKLKEQKVVLEAINSGHYDAQKTAAKDAEIKRKQIEMLNAHKEALKENKRIDAERAAQSKIISKSEEQQYKKATELNKNLTAHEKARTQESIRARSASIKAYLEEKQALEEVTRSYSYHDKEAQKYHKALQEKQTATKKAIAADYEYHDAQAKAYQMVKLHTQALKENKEITERWAQAKKENIALNQKEAAIRKEESLKILEGIKLREKERNIMASDNRRSNIIEIANEAKERKKLFASLKQTILEREKERAIMGADNRRANIVEISKETKARKEFLAVMKAEIIAGEAQRAKERESIRALNSFKEKQIELQRKVADSYDYHDKEAQKHNENLQRQREFATKLSDAYDKVITRVKQFAAFIVAAAVVQTLTQAISGAISVIIDFDQSLKSLQAIAGATATESLVMGDAIKRIAAETKFSAQEVANGMQTIGKAGFSAGEALQMLEGVSNLATGALEDFNKVSSLVVTAIRAFGMEVVQTNQITDIFANAITGSKLSLEGLTTAFGYVGAAGSQAGLTLNEVSGTLMVLADNGIRASTMGTALRKTLLSMIAPNESLKSALYSVGMSIDKINPGMVGYEQALKNLTPLVWDFEQGTVDMAKAQEFFGIRASQVAAILVRETAAGGGISMAIESTKELGSALRMAEKQQEGLGVKFKNLSDTIKNVALAIGDAGLTNVLHTLVDALKAAATGMENFIKAVPIVEFTGYIVAIGGISAAVYGLINALKMLFASSFIKAIMGGFLSTPLGWITAAIIGAAGAATYFSNKLDDTSESFKKNSIAINENISTLEGWGRVLDTAATKGLTDYNAAIVRFVTENKELSDAVIQNINDQKLLGEQSASTMAQVSDLAGTFENFVAVIKTARKNVQFEQNIESIKQLTNSIEIFAPKYIKLQEDINNFSNMPVSRRFSKEDIERNLSTAIESLTHLKDKFETTGIEIAEKLFDASKLKENGRKFASEYIAQLKQATKLPQEFFDSLEKELNALFGNLGKTAGKSGLVALKKIFGSIPEEIKSLEKNIPIIDISNYEQQKEALKKNVEEMRATIIESDLFKEMGISVTELTNILEKYYHEELKKLVTDTEKATEKTLDMSDALDRVKKTVADQEELKTLALKVQTIEELGSVHAAELSMEEKALDAKIDSMNLSKTEKVIYKKLIDTIKDYTKAEKAAEEQRAKDKTRKDRILSLTQEIALMQTYLDNLNSGMSIKEADNALELRRAEIKAINEDLDVEQLKNLQELKNAIEDKKDAIKDDIKTTEEQQKAYEDFSDTVQEFTADILDDWENAWESMLNILKTTIAEMAAEILTTKLIVPVALGMGSAMGMSWKGTSFADMSGGNFGIGQIGTLWNALSGGMTSSVYGGLTSGMLGQAGAGLFGASWAGGSALSTGALAAGGELGWGAANMAALGTGTGMGGIAGAIAAAAPYAAIAAIAIPILTDLFGNEKNPKTGFTSGSLEDWGRNPGVGEKNSSKFSFSVWNAEYGGDEQNKMADAVTSYFDARFTALDEMFDWSFDDVLANRQENFQISTELSKYDGNVSALLADMSDQIFEEIGSELVGMVFGGTQVNSFDTDFFRNISRPGEDLFGAFTRFATVMDSFSDPLDRVKKQLAATGGSAEEAFEELYLISEILKKMDESGEALSSSNIVTAFENMVAAQHDYIDAMEEAHATQEELSAVIRQTNEEIGASLTGITANNISSGLLSGNPDSIKDSLARGMADTIAGIAGEDIYSTYFSDINDQFGKGVQELIDSGEFSSESLADLMDSVFEGFDWDSVSAATEEAIEMIDDLIGAEGELGASSEDTANALGELKEAMDREQAIIDAKISAADNIKDFLDGLEISDSAPTQSMEFYQRRYAELLNEAKSATTPEEIAKATSNLTDFTSKYLEFAGAYGGTGYSDIYEGIKADLGGLELDFRSEAEKQTEYLADIKEVIGEVDESVLSLVDAFNNYVEKSGISTEGFALGGISTGPLSGYTATLHGTEAVIPLQTGSVPVQLQGGTGDVQVIVKIGERELNDVTTEIIRTDPEAQSEIRRVANG